MRGALSRLWRDHKALTAGFGLAVALCLFLAFRTVFSFSYWMSHRDASIEGWMTVGYVARSYDVPREALAGSLGLIPGTRNRITLEDLAAERGVPLAELEATLQAAIEAERARQ